MRALWANLGSFLSAGATSPRLCVLATVALVVGLLLQTAPTPARASAAPTSSTASTALNVTGTWAPVAALGNVAIDSHPVTGTDGKIYTVTSTNTSQGTIVQVAAYAPTTNTWAFLARLPTISGYTLSAFALAPGADGRIYAFGGYAATYLNTAFAYNPTTNSWATLAPMPTARAGAAAATGPDGRMYVIGGGAQNVTFNVVEAYTPSTNSWATMAPLPTAASGLTAATGADGRIYAAGGYQQNGVPSVNWMEAYTPSTNTWASAPNVPTPSGISRIVANTDGRIYAVGSPFSSTSPIEVYVYWPTLAAWGFGPPLPVTGLAYDAASTLDGRIITFANGLNALTITGTTTAGSPTCMVPGRSSFPAAGAWGSRASLCESRDSAAATTGPNARGTPVIYVLGGNVAETYDPSVDAWSELPSIPQLLNQTWAGTGSDGRIYVFGSSLIDDGWQSLAAAYDPVAGAWASVPPAPNSAEYFGAVAGPKGLLYALTGPSTLPAAPFPYTFAVYNPATSAWTTLAPPPYYSYAIWTLAQSDGKIYAFMGSAGQVEVYDPASNQWSFAPLLHTFRVSSAMTAGTDGQIYVLGGWEEIQGTLSSLEVLSPGRKGWSSSAPMPLPHAFLSAATDAQGHVYAIGGEQWYWGEPIPSDNDPTALEVYTPTTPVPPAPNPLGQWRSLAPLPNARTELAAASSPDGHIYTVGGQQVNDSTGHCIPQSTAEVYSPTTGTWTVLPPMPTARFSLAAVVAGDNRLYAIGGWTDCVPGSTPITTVEAYNPSTNQWSSVASLPVSSSATWAWRQSDGTIYAITDYWTNLTSHALSFNPTTGSWTDLGQITPPPFGGNLADGPNGQLDDVGGLISSYPTTVDVSTYDAATNAWDAAPSMLLQRSFPAAAIGLGLTHANELFAIGGTYGSKFPIGSYSAEALAPNASAWTEVASLPRGQEGFATTTWNNHVVILGGTSSFSPATYTSDVMEYLPPG